MAMVRPGVWIMNIDWSEGASVNLLSGQRGSGKSTQLRRLEKILAGQGCVVFRCDMSDYLNLTTPVEISDFFFSMMGALGDAAGEKYGKSFLKENYWDRAVRFLKSDIGVEETRVKTGIADFKASLKNDPSFKAELQKHMRGHIAALIRQAHAFSDEVVDYVRRKTGDPEKKAVLILDSIEQIRGVGEEAQSVYDSVENLFSAHAEHLRLSLMHVVYTVPPYLPPLVPGLGRNLGTASNTLPSLHVRKKGDGADDPEGLKILSDIVAHRFERWSEVFTPDAIQRMGRNTAGDLRDFFRLIREVLSQVSIARSAALPVQDGVLEEAENKLRREMLPIADADRAWLKRISESKSAELPGVKDLPTLARYFDTNLIQNYRNGEDWYDVHPLIRHVLD